MNSIAKQRMYNMSTRMRVVVIRRARAWASRFGRQRSAAIALRARGCAWLWSGEREREHLVSAASVLLRLRWGLEDAQGYMYIYIYFYLNQTLWSLVELKCKSCHTALSVGMLCVSIIQKCLHRLTCQQDFLCCSGRSGDLRRLSTGRRRWGSKTLNGPSMLLANFFPSLHRLRATPQTPAIRKFCSCVLDEWVTGFEVQSLILTCKTHQLQDLLPNMPSASRLAAMLMLQTMMLMPSAPTAEWIRATWNLCALSSPILASSSAQVLAMADGHSSSLLPYQQLPPPFCWDA